MQLGDTSRVLDLATGTGGSRHPRSPRPTLERASTGVDPSAKMLDVGRVKVACPGPVGRACTLALGIAEELPFEDGTFDAVSIAFGIRNVPDRPKRALREMARVTRPGGRVVILELAEPRGGLMGPLARFHVHTVVPWVGGLISGSHEYRYLQRSIAAFPPADEFAELMTEAGLDVLETRPLTFGVSTLYVAEPRSA